MGYRSSAGFKREDHRMPETNGIWIWSEIFTHDFENGDKVAIILIDTQGIFDDESSWNECTTMLAMSIALSSVQCYNVMFKHNVQEDHLQHLRTITERFAQEQSNEKPFQNLLFIVRDWPFAAEYGYGWNEPNFINFLAEKNIQNPKLRHLQKPIQSSFSGIDAFLMPYPGRNVAEGHYSGNVHDISSDFMKYLNELVSSIFAPQNLRYKKINGENMKVRDFVQYLEAYLHVFNGNPLVDTNAVFNVS